MYSVMILIFIWWLLLIYISMMIIIIIYDLYYTIMWSLPLYYQKGNKGTYPPDSQCPEWSAARHTDVGFGLMTVHDDKIDWSFYKSSYATTDKDSAPVILDQFQLVR